VVVVGDNIRVGWEWGGTVADGGEGDSCGGGCGRLGGLPGNGVGGDHGECHNRKGLHEQPRSVEPQESYPRGGGGLRGGE